MAEAISVTPLLNERKKYAEANSAKKALKSMPTVPLRRGILASQNADGLSDQDLRYHVSELRKRKFFSLIPFVVIPSVVLAFRYNIRLVLLSLIPTYYIYRKVYSSRFFNGRSEFSFEFAKNSEKRHIQQVYKAKEMFVGGSAEMWNSVNSKLNKNSMSQKDWMARNEHR